MKKTTIVGILILCCNPAFAKYDDCCPPLRPRWCCKAYYEDRGTALEEICGHYGCSKRRLEEGYRTDWGRVNNNGSYKYEKDYIPRTIKRP